LFKRFVGGRAVLPENLQYQFVLGEMAISPASLTNLKGQFHEILGFLNGYTWEEHRLRSTADI
jgi:hypothetical protein